MTTSATTMASADHEDESRQGLIHEATKINTEGHNVLGAEHQVALAEAAIKEHEERSPDLLKVHSKVVMKHLAFLFGLFCVYCIDVILFGATAEYVVGLATDNPLLVFLGKYGVPLFILGIEVICSLMMIEARKETKEEEEEAPSHDNSRAASPWVWLGILMAVVMPFTAIATAFAAQVVANDAAPILMLIVLGVISLSAHLLILFGGKQAHASKTYLLFVIKYRGLKRELAARRDVLRRHVQKLQALFIWYFHHWCKHNEVYNYVQAGPFDKDVAELLRRQFPHLYKASSDDGAHRR